MRDPGLGEGGGEILQILREMKELGEVLDRTKKSGIRKWRKL